MNEKICTKCKNIKNINNFYKGRGMKDGHLNQCKECLCKYFKKNTKKIKRECIVCKKEFGTSITAINKNLGKFCSWKCWCTYQKDNTKTEHEHHAWKGNNIKYPALHTWVRKKLGTPKFCLHCKNKNLKHRQYQWANISHEYKRDLSDWMRLCTRCHIKYDRLPRKQSKKMKDYYKAHKPLL